jgi:hypothetical protein
MLMGIFSESNVGAQPVVPEEATVIYDAEDGSVVRDTEGDAVVQRAVIEESERVAISAAVEQATRYGTWTSSMFVCLFYL